MKRILFVDDEPRFLEGLRRMLRSQRREWDMKFAVGPRAALAELVSAPFDVVVSDMRMPVMDGVALLAEVQQRHPGTVRIVLSGYSDPEAVTRATRVAHQFLSKPCSADGLKEAMERMSTLKARDPSDVARAVGDGIDAVSHGSARPFLFAAPDLLVLIHRDGTILDVHVPHDQPRVMAADVAAGTSIHEVLPPVLAKQVMRHVIQALQTDEAQCFRYERQSTGATRRREICMVKRGQEAVLCIVRDVLDSVRAEVPPRERRGENIC